MGQLADVEGIAYIFVWFDVVITELDRISPDAALSVVSEGANFK